MDDAALSAPRRGTGAPAVATVAILLLIVSGCSAPQESQPPDPTQMVDSGSWYSREQWPHDGNPYATENFVVYSDGASLESRQRLGSLAEEVWREVIDVMGLEPASMFTFPAGQDKIDLYATRYHSLGELGARAYYAGIIIPSFDYEADARTVSVGVIRRALKHELVHVAEALLKGRFVGDLAVSDPRRMPVWFSEGTAEALSGGSGNGAPRTLDQIDELIAEYGRINPISWRVDIPFSQLAPGAYPNYYYPMAQLAVQYILDPDGMGRSPKDLTAVMRDMGDDVPFATAFEDHIGISQDEYQAQFFDLMDGYLPQSEFPFEALGLGVASLLGAVAMAGALIWGTRRWPVPVLASAVPGTARRPGRGLAAEVAALGVITVAVVARILFALGLEELPAGTNRALGYTVAAGYFVCSVGILLWAIHRRVTRPRNAYLIPLLVIALTLMAAVAIDWIV
jgi:hypothetical protein